MGLIGKVLNLEIISNPYNWAVVVLMISLAALFLAWVYPQFTHEASPL